MQLFCDESGIASEQQILVIGIVMTPNSNPVLEMIQQLRKKHSLDDEIHFSKHSSRKLALYDYVLN